ncbi:glycerol-3-phosphate dehydrogenase [Azohydromonas caseinilytica]|uniref:glycerol-3-phosphate dehydrogenase n=1 Tax=Azohydromonas caseinilytica TaxID=2728836 RepID=UPI00287369D7|nr:glycerol-3-phosphate dehydrogenase [Azohydromonas caseinilytica]
MNVSFPATELHCDVLIVGGGINGAGIARDLAGRGLRVLLCEQGDLAQHTSSCSTKLVHGGLRYLEHGEFALVRKALAERELFLRSAPHITRALRFVLPHVPELRPAWMLRAGLFLYDHLARRELLPASRTLNLRTHPAGAPLHPDFEQGFAYADGWVDDARLVLLCALDAAERGARVLTRWHCAGARRAGPGWSATLQAAEGASEAGVGGRRAGELRVQARALVNAAGPWAASFLHRQLQGPLQVLRLVRGSHIVLPRLFEHDFAYVFQSTDRRVLFAIPYEDDFTLLGTTEVELPASGEPSAAQASAAEVEYLCAQAGRYFRAPVRPAQVVWSYAGVRPLLDDGAREATALTRDYRLELEAPPAGAPLLNVWGGKITTFRVLAQEAAELLAPRLGASGGPWTAGAWLPGGDFSAFIGAAARGEPAQALRQFELALGGRWPDLPASLRRRWARLYGARIELLLRPGPALPQLGAEVAPGLFEAELRYLHRHEWAATAEDVLWRRTKLGLHMDAAARSRVAAWCAREWGRVEVSSVAC